MTNNEVSEKQATVLARKGYTPFDDEWAAHGICRSVAIPRCFSAITGKRPDGRSITVDCFTGRMRKMSASRAIKHLALGDGKFLNVPRRKELIGLTGLTQSKVSMSAWHIEDGKDTSILWDISHVDSFAAALTKEGTAVKTVLVPTDRQTFNAEKESIQSRIPPREWNEEEVRSISEGLPENLECFRLDFLDKDRVALKQAFREILLLLWMRAGCIGPRPELPARRTEPPFLLSDMNNFAVLLDEMRFAEFRKKLAGCTGVTHVFLVTDSHEAFEEMAAQISVPAVIQLYRDYLENFMINRGSVA